MIDNIVSFFVVSLDFQKSPSSDFIWPGTKNVSYLIGASFADPKTGRCAWTNQSSSQGPLGIKLSLTNTKRIETWLAVQISTWGGLRKRWKMLLRPRAIMNCVTTTEKQSKHISRGRMFLCLLQPELARVWLLSCGSIHFRSFIWRGLLCHRVGDCSVDVSHERSGLKPKFPRNESIVRRRRLLGRTAIGYFKSDRENSIWESRGDPQQLPTHFLSPKTKSPKITK